MIIVGLGLGNSDVCDSLLLVIIYIRGHDPWRGDRKTRENLAVLIQSSFFLPLAFFLGIFERKREGVTFWGLLLSDLSFF